MCQIARELWEISTGLLHQARCRLLRVSLYLLSLIDQLESQPYPAAPVLSQTSSIWETITIPKVICTRSRTCSSIKLFVNRVLLVYLWMSKIATLWRQWKMSAVQRIEHLQSNRNTSTSTMAPLRPNLITPLRSWTQTLTTKRTVSLLRPTTQPYARTPILASPRSHLR